MSTFLYRQYLCRVAKLKEKREKMEKTPKTQEDIDIDLNSEDDNDSDENLQDILNWRAKRA